MILYPAIDILGGKAVRLMQGDFEQRTEYDADSRWRPPGAGSMRAPGGCMWSTSTVPGPASPQILRTLERIAGGLGVPVQVGGASAPPPR